jgi:drug/metabolite transporter (DMT)-like permease
VPLRRTEAGFSATFDASLSVSIRGETIGAPFVSRKFVFFLVLSFIWGSTWIPAKLALSVVPPVMLAGIRFVPAGLLLLAIAALTGNGLRIVRRDWPRLAIVGLLWTTISYALMFWAMQYIRTGFAAVVDFTVVPVFLLAFAVIAGEEAFHWRQAMAIALGIVGLLFLFLPSLHGGSNMIELGAALVVILSVAAYCWGSVLARPLLRTYSSTLVAGVTNLAGGIVLVALSLAFEPRAGVHLQHWSWSIWLSWIYLFLFGTVVAATIFLVLVREWGPSRAGSYAFVSPAIAVFLGWLVFDERFGVMEGIGMMIMLTATYLALDRSTAAVKAAAE